MNDNTARPNVNENHEVVESGVAADLLTGHSYDGIQEYDNPLPGWWKWMFVASILIAPPYFMFYHGGAEGRSIVDEYDEALAANMRLQFAEIGELPLTRESVVKYLYEDSWLSFGKSIFRSKCVSCHGRDGGGNVGPNLCDDEYKNVKDIGDLLTVIQNGANAGAMPAWKTRLSPNELVLVASYVASLRGTTPATAKDPEGRPIAAWPGPPEVEEEETQDAGDGSASAAAPGAAAGNTDDG